MTKSFWPVSASRGVELEPTRYESWVDLVIEMGLDNWDLWRKDNVSRSIEGKKGDYMPTNMGMDMYFKRRS